MKFLIAVLLCVSAFGQYTPPSGGGSSTPSGPAGGDLGDTYPNPSVAKMGFFAVSGPASTTKTWTIPNQSINWTTLSGILKAASGVPSVATSADVIGLWSGTCNSSSVLGGDGVCAAVSSAFSGITSGTNTGAAMVIDTGASLDTSGSGTNEANRYNGLGGVTSAVPRASASQQLADSKLTVSGTPVTMILYDDTASTGVSQFNIRNGAGQSTTTPLRLYNNAGDNYVGFRTSDGFTLAFVQNGTSVATIDNGGNIGVGSAAMVVWNGTTRIRAGAGSPEGVISAPVGSLWLRSDGGAGTSFYVKESGSGNTGWVAK